MTSERYISSAHNPDYKNWLLLAKGKAVKNFDLSDNQSTFLILQGEHLCQSWLELYGLPQQVVISEDLLESGKFDNLWQACKKTRRNVLQANLGKSLSQVKNGREFFFIVKQPTINLPSQIEQSCIALDRVQDPGNLGTMLRTAAAAGIKHVFLSNGCAKVWSPKVLRSAQGAHFALDLFEHTVLAELAAKYNMPMACTTLNNASNLYATDLRQNCIWVFGNEGQGVSQELQDSCQLRLHIPQSAQVESLNVAAAAAICLFEQKRQTGDY